MYKSFRVWIENEVNPVDNGLKMAEGPCGSAKDGVVEALVLWFQFVHIFKFLPLTIIISFELWLFFEYTVCIQIGFCFSCQLLILDTHSWSHAAGWKSVQMVGVCWKKSRDWNVVQKLGSCWLRHCFCLFFSVCGMVPSVSVPTVRSSGTNHYFQIYIAQCSATQYSFIYSIFLRLKIIICYAKNIFANVCF